MKRFLIFIVLLILMSNVSYGANNILTNMTPSTSNGGYIGNATHNYTIRGLYYGTWLGDAITGLEPLWDGNYSLVAFKNINNVSNSTLWWAGLTAPLSSWLDTFNQTYHNYVYSNYSAKTDYVNNASERALFLSTKNDSYLIDTTSANNYIGVSGTINKTLTFSEAVLNTTIQAHLTTKTYNATSIATIYGTPSGNLAGITSYKDGVTYNITEANGANPSETRINFTNVNDFNSVFIREYYSGSTAHTIQIQIWDYTNSVWEASYFSFNGQSGYVDTLFEVFDNSNHINNSLVQLRLIHLDTGVSTHILYIDYAVLQDGITGFTSSGDGTGGWIANSTDTKTNLNVSTTQEFKGNINSSWILNVPNAWTTDNVGANISSTMCSGTQKVSAVNNLTGVVTCSVDVDTDTWNTTAEMIAAVNNSGTLNISINASNVQNPPWITGYTESDPKWQGNSSLVAYVADLVGLLGNWSADKASYVTITVFNSIGNWTADKVNYATTIALSSVGNWTNDRGNYINTTRAWTNDTNIGISGTTISFLGTIADARIASAAAWNAVMNYNYSSKTDHLNNATEAALYTNTQNSSYHGLWSSNRTSTSNSSSYWDNMDTTADITSVGTQAQNIDMGNNNITNTMMVNATREICVGNGICINDSAIYKVGGGRILFT